MDPETPKLIDTTLPNARIIIILRDPIERAFSFYHHAVRVGLEPETFGEAIRKTLHKNMKDYDLTDKILLEGGFYYEQVKSYLDIFGTDRVKVLIFEEFIQNKEKIIKQVCKFLGINYFTLNFEKIHNPYSVPSNTLSKTILSSTIIKKIFTKFFSHDFSKEMADRFLLKTINKPEMKNEDKLFLQKIYQEDVKKLELLLGRSIGWMNF